MKKIYFFTLLLCNFFTNAQSLSYSDIAVLFSTNDNLGTARYMGLSGAFGALGGDMTAVDINPAGLAVYKNSEFSTSFGWRDTKNETTFYGNTLYNNDDYFRFLQIGGVFATKIYGNSDFKKMSFGFNYNVIKDFNNNYAVQGNSGVPDFVDDPYLNYDGNDFNNVYYDNVDNQLFLNYTSGINDRFSFSFATQYKDILYFGGSLAFQHINFYQNTTFEEANNDGAGNTLDARLRQYLSVYGNGFNFGLGVIVKPVQNLRIGVSYQSPIWYNLAERFQENLDISVSNDPDLYTEYNDPNYFDYQLKTPAKVTGSIAYVFGKLGLISLDYIYQDYTNTRLQPSSVFIDENQDLSNGLRSTSSLRVGTEWRVKIVSIRGGYRFVQSPYKNAASAYDLNGYSMGLGFKITRFVNLDFAYDNSNHSEQYGFLNIDGVEPAYIDINSNRFTSSLVLVF